MNIIITGGGGFLGTQLVKLLLARGSLTLQPGNETVAIERIVLADQVIGAPTREAVAGSAIPVEFREGDVAAPGFIAGCFPDDPNSPVAVYHLASVVSGGAEQDFDLALRVNLDPMRELMERCRHWAGPLRLVFTSSVATYGGHAMTPCVSDRTKQIPQTTYGMTKMIGELLINDYARKGFVDGRGARLPTVFVRPGKPNLAASSFASGVIREPLNGVPCELPVARSQQMPLLSYGKIVEGLVILLEADAAQLGDDRTVNFPSTTYTVAEMITAMEAVAARRGITLGPVIDAPNATIEAIVAGWPVATEYERATALGMTTDASLEGVIERYIDDFVEV